MKPTPNAKACPLHFFCHLRTSHPSAPSVTRAVTPRLPGTENNYSTDPRAPRCRHGCKSCRAPSPRGCGTTNIRVRRGGGRARAFISCAHLSNFTQTQAPAGSRTGRHGVTSSHVSEQSQEWWHRQAAVPWRGPTRLTEPSPRQGRGITAWPREMTVIICSVPGDGAWPSCFLQSQRGGTGPDGHTDPNGHTSPVHRAWLCYSFPPQAVSPSCL